MKNFRNFFSHEFLCSFKIFRNRSLLSQFFGVVFWDVLTQPFFFTFYLRIVAWPFPFKAGLRISATFSPGAIVSSFSVLNWAGGAGMGSRAKSSLHCTFDRIEARWCWPPLFAPPPPGPRKVAVEERLDEGLVKSMSGRGTCTYEVDVRLQKVI